MGPDRRLERPGPAGRRRAASAPPCWARIAQDAFASGC